MPGSGPRRRLRLYVSYADQDDSFRRELRKHLTPLSGNGQIEIWDRSQAQEEPGKDLDTLLRQRIDDADLVLVLLSADYLGGELSSQTELPYALERQRKQATQVLLILIRAVAWQSSEVLSGLKVWPGDDQAVSSWPNRDAVWTDLVSLIGRQLTGSESSRRGSRGTSAPVERTPLALPPQPYERGQLDARRSLSGSHPGPGRQLIDGLSAKTGLYALGVLLGCVATLGAALVSYTMGAAVLVCVLLLGGALLLMDRRSAESRYFRHLIVEYKHVGLQGLRLGANLHPDIGRVFVELRIAPSPDRDRAASGLLSAPELLGHRSIWDFIRSFDEQKEPLGIGLAIIGPPGCGKTTLLRHVAVTVARRQHRAHRIRDRIPIYLSLRSCAAELLSHEPPNLAELLTERSIRGPFSHLRLPTGWLRAQLESGRALVLLDGLDEVGDPSQRPLIARWIDVQIRLYADCLFILTSRPYGFRESQLDRVQVLETVPFSTTQVHEFLHNWYVGQALASPLRERLSGTEQAHRVAQELVERLATQPELSELAKNPLLLTMMALLHRRGPLPRHRAALYEEICKMMLDTRPAQRGQLDGLSLDAKRRILGAFAAYLMAQRVRELAISDAATFLAPLLAAESAPDMDAKSFLHYVQIESGLLHEPEAERIGFAHLSFQEYLAAVEWARTRSFPLPLAELVADSWWQESLRLWAAQSDASELLRICLASDSLQALTLASVCLQEAHTLDDAVRAAAQTALVAALESGEGARFRLAAEVRLRRRLRELIPLDDTKALDGTYLTQAEYQLFLDENSASGQYFQPDHWSELRFPVGQGLRPVTGVRPSDIAEFCIWLSERMDAPACRRPSAQEAAALPARSGEGLGTSVGPPDLIVLSEAAQKEISGQAQQLSSSPAPLRIAAITAAADVSPQHVSEMKCRLPVLNGAFYDIGALFDLARCRNVIASLAVSPARELARQITALIDAELAALYWVAGKSVALFGGTLPTALDLLSSVLPVTDIETLRALLAHPEQLHAETQATTGRWLQVLRSRLSEDLVPRLDDLRSEAGTLRIQGTAHGLLSEWSYLVDATLSGCRTLLDDPKIERAVARPDLGAPAEVLAEIVSTLSDMDRLMTQARALAAQINTLGQIGVALSAGDFALARQLARQVASTKISGMRRRLTVIAACLDVLVANAPVRQRTAARRAVVRVIQDALSPESSGNRRPDANRGKSAATELQDLLWWCQVQLAREEGKMPAWEGVRVLQERRRGASEEA